MTPTPRRLMAALGLALAGLITSAPAQAVPSYARQTGQDCTACHVGGFGPQLTPYGVKFKIGGYTESDNKLGKLALSGMVVASHTRTGKAQDAPPADGTKTNNNTVLDEASLFVAGKLADKLGAFVQITYDGIGKTVALDQMDLRLAHSTELQGKDLVLGLSLNNNPGVQDPFNTLPVWGFPYIGSALGFGGVETGTLINGGLEQRVLGLSAYGFWDNQWYAELGSYRSLSRTGQARLGLDRAGDPGRLGAGNVYWRTAWFQDRKRDAWSVGLFGMNALLQPDRSPGTPGNRYSDLGVDAQYQFLGTRQHVFTVQGSHVREHQTRDALLAAGQAQQLHGTLRETRLNASYHYRQTWGVTLGHFQTTGSTDATLFGANPGLRPDTAGNVVQADWTPFGKEDSWGNPWANLRLGVQYTAYTQYNGARRDYDGAGRNAADNNTLYLFAWTTF